MNTGLKRLFLWILIAVLHHPLPAQDFQNLDFEMVVVDGPIQLPFWDTNGALIYNVLCLGSICTSIHDIGSNTFLPLEGTYSVHIDPGTDIGDVNFLAQSGTLPGAATILTLLVDTPHPDSFQIAFDGTTLTVLAQVPGQRWVYDISDFSGTTGELIISQTAPDNNGTGALLDDIRFVALGDVNLDGIVNLLDVAPFVELVLTGTFQAEADINHDGKVNLLDVGPFVELLSDG